MDRISISNSELKRKLQLSSSATLALSTTISATRVQLLPSPLSLSVAVHISSIPPSTRSPDRAMDFGDFMSAAPATSSSQEVELDRKLYTMLEIEAKRYQNFFATLDEQQSGLLPRDVVLAFYGKSSLSEQVRPSPCLFVFFYIANSLSLFRCAALCIYMVLHIGN